MVLVEITLFEKLDTSVDKWNCKIHEKKQKITEMKLHINKRKNKKENFQKLPQISVK
jgi:hypothetical protein